MTVPFLDTNVFIRFLTGDDPEKQAACRVLFEQIERGEIRVFVPDVIIAECVFVLSSRRGYNRSRQEIAEFLTPLLQLSHLQVQNRALLLRTMHVYAETRGLDFEDAYIVAAIEQTENPQLLSYDTDFDQFPFLTRKEPAPARQTA